MSSNIPKLEALEKAVVQILLTGRVLTQKDLDELVKRVQPDFPAYDKTGQEMFKRINLQLKQWGLEVRTLVTNKSSLGNPDSAPERVFWHSIVNKEADGVAKESGTTLSQDEVNALRDIIEFLIGRAHDSEGSKEIQRHCKPKNFSPEGFDTLVRYTTQIYSLLYLPAVNKSTLHFSFTSIK